MIRCPLRHAALAVALAIALPSQASTAGTNVPAAVARHLPAQAHYGTLVVEQVPSVLLNGQKLRTAPGFRLFSADNKLIFAHTVAGQPLRVAYVLEDRTGWLLTAWILNPHEQAPTPR
ncbi:MAG: hypothetical protein ACI4QS_06690 [Comamonas sp.]